jgi:hypothetical protein
MINGILLIIVLQVAVIMLTSCSMFEEKIEHLECKAEDMTLCAGWKI